jgi:ZU5 domain
MKFLTLKNQLIAFSIAFIAADPVHAVTSCGFNVDGVDVSSPGDLTSDALLIAKFARQATGASLLAGSRLNQAPENVATYVTAINDHMSFYRAAHDIDASGQVDVNDITLIARYTAGFRGQALVQGLTLSNNRSLAADIEQYIRDGCAKVGTTTVTGSIGPAGGSLGLADGLRLIVPPGALAAQTNVTLREAALPAGTLLPPTGVLAGRTYSFEPDGLQFLKAAKIIVPYELAQLPAGYNEGDVLIHRRSAAAEFHVAGYLPDIDQAVEAPAQTQDRISKTLSALIGGFSSYGAVGNSQANTWIASTITSNSDAASVVVRRPPLACAHNDPSIRAIVMAVVQH